MNNSFDPADILKRIFEPYPDDWATRFKIGDRVRIMRPEITGIIPNSAEGMIVDIETEGVMAEKGRPYLVCFDLKPFSIKARDVFPVTSLCPVGNEIIQSTTTNLGPNDICKIAIPTSE